MSATPQNVGVGIVLMAALTFVGCSRLGFSNRVLLRLASPDGNMVFVCQEIPELDGPGHEWRLERQDGTVVRRLLKGSDGNGACDEALWSTNGSTLAVVSRATIHIADVEWTLSHPELQKTHWFVRQFGFSGPLNGQPRFVRDLQFVAPGELTFGLCADNRHKLRDRRVDRCEAGETVMTLTIPSPLVPGRAS
jgi:hypothetical protein